ncbi:MAG TPA: pseudouridine synthase [Lachnospiraceae bacterium]|nr:pseudouridine synthase [Lachnospiraceae bacterium]
MIRLDKYLADMGVGTRSEVKNYIRKRKISVNSEVVADPNRKIILGEDEVLFEGNLIGYVSIEYYMLNKPAGVLSATEDKRSTTVIDLITTSKRKDLFPVGRLDKDTEGLLIITNDGELAHNLLSPRKHVDKVYFARIDGMVTEDDVVKFEQGLVIDEELTAKPAKLVILSSGEESEIKLTIQEGKFHQVKRMFEAVGKKVTYLKRLSMGTLQLDPTLEPGQYRELSEGEITALRS